MKLFPSTRNLFDFALCALWSASARPSAMDRMKNSMQQVPNAIPKVIRRTGGANSLELEKENFERGQVRSRKAILIKSMESCVRWEWGAIVRRGYSASTPGSDRAVIDLPVFGSCCALRAAAWIAPVVARTCPRWRWRRPE